MGLISLPADALPPILQIAADEERRHSPDSTMTRTNIRMEAAGLEQDWHSGLRACMVQFAKEWGGGPRYHSGLRGDAIKSEIRPQLSVPAINRSINKFIFLLTGSSAGDSLVA
jgi:hypothetical protein